jgi:hypothetical protein
VTCGVTRHVHHLEVEIEIREGHEITALDRVIDDRNIVASRTEDRYRIDAEKFPDATDVIGVMVGEKDGAELEPSLLQDLEYRPRFAGIDDHRRRRRGVGQEPDIVVAECRYGFEEWHLTMLPGSEHLRQ